MPIHLYSDNDRVERDSIKIYVELIRDTFPWAKLIHSQWPENPGSIDRGNIYGIGFPNPLYSRHFDAIGRWAVKYLNLPGLIVISNQIKNGANTVLIPGFTLRDLPLSFISTYGLSAVDRGSLLQSTALHEILHMIHDLTKNKQRGFERISPLHIRELRS